MIPGLVSVIIPTHKGAEKQTERLVESIKQSTYKGIEIIVINEGKERSIQRNIGIRRAKGEFIFWPDSDWVVLPGTIEWCVIRMQKYDALYIGEVLKTPGVFGYIRNWERQFYTGTAIDVVRFIRASQCPFFDESMSGPEDTAWDRHHQVSKNRGIAQTHYEHHDGIGFIKYFQKKAYYAKSMYEFEKKYPGDKILDWRWRCFGVFFEKGKWKHVLKRPDLFLCVMFIIFIRGIIYLCARKS